MFGMSTTELIIIVLVILLLFGGKKIPELMKGLGQGVKSFKEGMNEDRRNHTRNQHHERSLTLFLLLKNQIFPSSDER